MTQQEKEKMFLDLNGVLVKFWIEQGRPDKEVRVELLERMLNWYRKMGYCTLDKQEPSLPSDVDEAAEKFVYDWAGLSPTERRIAERAYLAGAEWQKEQMMEEWLKDRDGCFWDGVEEGKKVMEEQMLKDAVDARVYYRDSVPGGEFIEIVADILNPTGVRYKDKVKIVIVKEDKV